MAARDLAGSEKKALAEQRIIVFIDESGFRLLPMLVSTWAPCGQTPILRVPLRWQRLSMIAAITPDGKLYTRIQKHGFRTPHILRFLKHLLHHVSGKLLIVWDNLSAHRSKLIKQFVSQHHRIDVLHLPPYAPELNPTEMLWNYLKRTELKNLCCKDIQQLRYELKKAVERVRHRQPILQSFVRHLYDDL